MQRTKGIFLYEIMIRIGDYERSSHDREIQSKMTAAIQKMTNEEIDRFLEQLMPKIATLIKETLKL